MGLNFRIFRGRQRAFKLVVIVFSILLIVAVACIVWLLYSKSKNESLFNKNDIKLAPAGRYTFSYNPVGTVGGCAYKVRIESESYCLRGTEKITEVKDLSGYLRTTVDADLTFKRDRVFCSGYPDSEPKFTMEGSVATIEKVYNVTPSQSTNSIED